MRGAGNGPVSGTVLLYSVYSLLHTPHRHVWGKFKRGGGAWAYHGCRVMSRIILRVRGLVEKDLRRPRTAHRPPLSREPFVVSARFPCARRVACAFRARDRTRAPRAKFAFAPSDISTVQTRAPVLRTLETSRLHFAYRYPFPLEPLRS
jgi:hypothetical protein